MLEELRKQVYDANMELPGRGINPAQVPRVICTRPVCVGKVGGRLISAFRFIRRGISRVSV